MLGASLVALTLATTLAVDAPVAAPPPPPSTPRPGPPPTTAPAQRPASAPAPTSASAQPTASASAQSPAPAPAQSPTPASANPPAPAQPTASVSAHPPAYPPAGVSAQQPYPAAHAAWIETQAARYRQLQAATDLDLTGMWKDYVEQPRRDDFVEFAKKRFRRRLGTGIGFTLGGAALMGAGTAIFIIAGDNDNTADAIGGILVMTTGTFLFIPGVVLWPVYQVRLHKLRKAEAKIAARPGLRGLGPIPLPRGAGLGLRLDF